MRLSSTLRILSWNILQGGGRRLTDQLAWIATVNADIVCLQEYRRRLGDEVMAAGLADDGLIHQYIAPVNKETDNTLLIAASMPFESQVFPTEWPGQPHLVQAHFNELRVGPGEQALEIFSAHFPQKKAQVPLFDALLNASAQLADTPALLIGDINCGIPFEDSQTKTFANTHMFAMLLARGWVDSWRSRNPKAREFTWRSARTNNGFRYDHALATKVLDGRVRSVRYDHDVRRNKTSDHSALVVELQL